MLNSIAVLYTMMGGMKAVIWTDVVQSGVLVSSLVIVTGKLWWDLGYTKIIEDVQEFVLIVCRVSHEGYTVNRVVKGMISDQISYTHPHFFPPFF